MIDPFWGFWGASEGLEVEGAGMVARSDFAALRRAVVRCARANHDGRDASDTRVRPLADFTSARAGALLL